MSNELVQKFLDMLIQLVHSNPSLHITERFVYAQLVSFRLGDFVIPFENVEKYFRDWITTFQKQPSIDVYRDKKNPFICHFASKTEAETKIKIYIPMSSQFIKNGVLELFTYLNVENIIHDSKVFSSIRNDNVIVKVSTIEEANKIIKFIKTNFYISEGLMSQNPFLFPCGKVGVIIDNSYTYNVEVCKVLASLLKELRDKKELKNLDCKFLRNTFIKLSIKCNDDELSDLYRLASIVLDENSSLQDFANHVLEHQQNSYENKHGKVGNKESIEFFNQAILQTFERYHNLSFVINAIKLYLLHDDARGFTREYHARENLTSYVSKEHLKNLFEEDNLDFSIKYYVLKLITKQE